MTDGSVAGAFGLLEERSVLDPDRPRPPTIRDRHFDNAKGYRPRPAIGATEIGISTSQKTAPFFARFGAVIGKVTEDGWGPGLDRVEMTLPI